MTVDRQLGAEFIVRLPIAAESVLAKEAAPAPFEERPMRVLVVDDNEDAAEALGILLGTSGYGVRVAGDGLTALAIAERFEPHAALVDIGMPGIDGFELARRLRSIFASNVLLIAMTGHSHEDDRRRSRDAGFDHHLVKPFDWSSLHTLFAGYDSERLRRDPEFGNAEGT
jgi:CheY-like chemotaxis protein